MKESYPIIHKTVLFALLLLLRTSLQASAEVTYTEGDADNPTVIRMTVSPAAEPVPALRHRLIARDIDLKSGNAAPYYYRALMQSSQSITRIRDKFNTRICAEGASCAEDDQMSRWYGTGVEATPIADLPLDNVREASQMFDWVVDGYLADATMRRDCDWELGVEEIRGPDVISFLLPEFQNSREIARMLSLRTRLAITERRYDDAIDSMRMNYRLGRDVAKPPFLVCGLIGIAIQGITNGTLVELIAAPDSPNLYWALSELPQPLIDMREAARFELDFGLRMFPFIHHAETTDRSPAEWNRLFTDAFRDLSKINGQVTVFGAGAATQTKTVAGIVATAVGLAGYPHAKAQLIAQGLERDRVEKMAVGQVLAIYTERNYQRFANEYEKLWYMPFWEMRRRGDAIEQQLAGSELFGGAEDREVLPLVSLLLPAMQAVRNAQVRLERDIAALRVIEALRMHAASHDGRLPSSLDEIDEVPVPPNAATGKPFVYRLDGQTAILELPAADGIPSYNRRFEIQIAATIK